MANKTKQAVAKSKPRRTRVIVDRNHTPIVGAIERMHQDPLMRAMDAFYDEANDDSNIGHPGHPSNHGDH